MTVLFGDLVRVETRLWNVVDARLRAECDLPLTWFEPMRLMAGGSACRVQDIAAELAITIGGTSKLVDRIEGAGLCRRRTHPHDRRSSIIELTAPGRRRLAEAEVVFDDELRRRLGSAVPAPALTQLASTLRALRAALERPSDEETDRPAL